MAVAEWALTLEHWIFFLCASSLASIMCSTMIVYHFYNVYKHEMVQKTARRESKLTNTKESTTGLYNLTTILTIVFMITYLLSQSSSWIQTFGCSIEIGWACLLYQTAKGLMYIIFLIRLHIVYQSSIYAYKWGGRATRG